MYTISYIGTDYWSRIPVGASSSHRVCSPSAPSRRPTPPSNFSISAIYRFIFCTYLYPQRVFLTSHFASYYIFFAVLPPLYLYISAILYIFQLYCRPISFSFLIHTSGNVNITDYYTDRHVGLYGFYWSAHLVSWFLLWCCSPWFLLWCCSPWFLLWWLIQIWLNVISAHTNPPTNHQPNNQSLFKLNHQTLAK